MSTIKSSTTLTTAYSVEADTTGTLVFQTGAGPTTAVTIGTDQSFNFSATGQRITGDFSNATLANRVMFQSSSGTFSDVGVLAPSSSTQSTSFACYLGNDPTNTSRIRILANSAEGRVESSITGTGTYLPMTFYTGGSERMRIDTSGNVLIGSSTANAKLYSYATSGTTTTLGRFEAAIGSYTGTSLIAANTLGASSSFNLFSCITDSDGDAGGPVTQFLVRGDGNVGIGTSSPQFKLDLNYGDVTGPAMVISGGRIAGGNPEILFKNSYWSGGNYGPASVVAGDNGSAGGYIAFKTTTSGSGTTGVPTERMRIDSSGNLLVGQTSQSGSEAFGITRAANTATYIHMVKTSQVECTWGLKSSTDSNMYIGSGSPNVGTYGVYLTNTGNSWNAVSDERMKTIVEPISNAIQKIGVLRSVIGYYNHDENKIHRPFLIAQDVQSVLPEAVSIADQETGILGLSYTDTIPLLVAAIKEQQALIQQLQADVAALKGTS